MVMALLAMPQPLLAGTTPFDNNGRLRCDSNGLIDRSDPIALEQKAPMELEPGAIATIPSVCPAERYFPSGVIVTPGATYQISAQGLWKDGWITVGAQGWWGLLFEAWNRLPWKPFFLLGGSIGQSDQKAFPIGLGRRWIAPNSLPSMTDRQLYFFANDWPSKLQNNRTVSDTAGGPMRVTVLRIK